MIVWYAVETVGIVETGGSWGKLGKHWDLRGFWRSLGKLVAKTGGDGVVPVDANLILQGNLTCANFAGWGGDVVGCDWFTCNT